MWNTPAETSVIANEIPNYRAARQPTRFAGCSQVNGLFLKADGSITCSCSRYWTILADAREVDLGIWYNGAVQRYVRESFIAGAEPFAFCKDCSSRVHEISWARTEIEPSLTLHVEPSSQCNLFCSAQACTCTFERQSLNPPPRHILDFAIYERALGELHRAGLLASNIAFVGFGEPLFNSRLPDMARLGRALFPAAHLYTDTNANFGTRRAEEIADCGLDDIRLGIDGCDQASYVAYRVSGDFAKAYSFAGKLAAAVRAAGSATKVVWKYILFKHNDRDEQILRAVELAGVIGVPIIFDLTVGELASRRTLAELQAVIGDHQLRCNIAPDASGLAPALP